MKYTKQELANKIDWEGGIIAALEYRITHGEIEDEEIAKLWEQLEQFLPIMDQIYALLPEPGLDESEDE